MSTSVNVLRYHLVDRTTLLVATWGVLTFVFLLNLVIFGLIPIGNGGGYAHGRYDGGLASLFIIFCIIGALTIFRSLPFGLTLGASRRSYYIGTGLLAVTLGATYGLVLTVLQAIERATDGWGVAMHFFVVPYILAGPWYLTWLTTFVGLTVLFVYGMWYGIVYRRWNLIGMLTFGAAQATVLLAAALVTTWAHGWPAVGRFFTTLSASGLTGLLAALAVVLLVGGFSTIRRATV